MNHLNKVPTFMIGQAMSYYRILENVGRLPKMARECLSKSGCHFEDPAVLRRELEEEYA